MVSAPCLRGVVVRLHVVGVAPLRRAGAPREDAGLVAELDLPAEPR